MATFPDLLPIYNTQETTNQDNQVVELGDGFQKRLVFGLPANKRLISLNLTFNVSTSDAKTINDFLNERFDDQASFDVSTSFRQNVLPDLTASPNFICTSRTRTTVLSNRVIINLSFQEVAEP